MFNCTLIVRFHLLNIFVVKLLGLMLSRPNDESERVKIACLLIENDADTTIKDNTGKTPLQICKSPRVRDGVLNFMKRMQQEKSQSGATAAGDPFLALLSALLVLPCISCNENVANATFRPCGHKLVCAECSVRFDACPKCRTDVEARIDDKGRRIVLENPCQVQ